MEFVPTRPETRATASPRECLKPPAEPGPEVHRSLQAGCAEPFVIELLPLVVAAEIRNVASVLRCLSLRV